METALGRKARFELPTPESTEKYVADVKRGRTRAGADTHNWSTSQRRRMATANPVPSTGPGL